jgi:hypothetical protein
MELILGGSDSQYVKELKISELSSAHVVCGGRTPLLFVNKFPTSKQYGIAVGKGFKIDSYFKNLHFMEHNRLNSIFCSLSRNRFFPISRSKITGLVFFFKSLKDQLEKR